MKNTVSPPSESIDPAADRGLDSAGGAKVLVDITGVEWSTSGCSSCSRSNSVFVGEETKICTCASRSTSAALCLAAICDCLKAVKSWNGICGRGLSIESARLRDVGTPQMVASSSS